jgi:hypothetical protein
MGRRLPVAVDYRKCLAHLTDAQRDAFVHADEKARAGHRLTKAEAAGLSDFSAIQGAQVLDALGIARMTLHNWIDDGCPRNKDGTYTLPDVFKWRMSKEESASMPAGGYKEEKLKKEIEFLQARIDEKNDVYITRELHETVLTSRAGSLREYFEKTFMSNAISLTGKTVDEVRAVLWDLLKRAMDAYIGKSTERD